MDPSKYPDAGIVELQISSTLDGSTEPSLFRPSDGSDPAPLLVVLHTWSADRHNLIDMMLPMATRNRWHMLAPEFRGPNRTINPRAPEACASPLAMRDVIDAVDHVRTKVSVDESRIYLIGLSGGGHMAMMLAGYRPKLWRSIAAFVGISDVEAWHSENASYAPHIAICCGGPPSDATREEYRRRSPMSYAAEIAQSELHLYHGKFDRSVPFTHSVRLFDAVCKVDPNARVFLNVFDGAHEALLNRAEEQFLGAAAPRSDVTG